MTREETIEQLNLTIGLIKQDGKDWLDDRDIPMLEECAKALSQEPCEDAVEQLKKYTHGKKNTDKVEISVLALNRITKALSQESMREFTEEEAKAYSKALDKMYKPTGFNVFDEPCADAISRILQRMWNCRGKHTTSIDKVAMEQIIRDELYSVTSKPIECDDTVSRGVFDQVRWERDIAIEQLHELGYELGQKIEPCGDAISRKDVIALIQCSEYELQDRVDNDDMCNDIRELPSITQKCEKCAMNGSGSKYCDNCGQKSGHWIPIPYELDYETDAECSLCHEKFIDAINYDYCPKCGYRMWKSEDK